jgi:arsenate reductase
VVNQYAVKAMAEFGIDIADHQSKSVDEFVAQPFDFVVTVCDHANETCPLFPGGKERLHKSFEDPAGVEGTDTEKLAMFRRIRDQIKDWLAQEFG